MTAEMPNTVEGGPRRTNPIIDNSMTHSLHSLPLTRYSVCRLDMSPAASLNIHPARKATMSGLVGLLTMAALLGVGSFAIGMLPLSFTFSRA